MEGKGTKPANTQKNLLTDARCKDKTKMDPELGVEGVEAGVWGKGGGVAV